MLNQIIKTQKKNDCIYANYANLRRNKDLGFELTKDWPISWKKYITYSISYYLTRYNPTR